MKWLDGMTDLMDMGLGEFQDPDPSSKATLWAKAQHEGAFHPRASSAKTRGFHTHPLGQG